MRWKDKRGVGRGRADGTVVSDEGGVGRGGGGVGRWRGGRCRKKAVEERAVSEEGSVGRERCRKRAVSEEGGGGVSEVEG